MVLLRTLLCREYETERQQTSTAAIQITTFPVDKTSSSAAAAAAAAANVARNL